MATGPGGFGRTLVSALLYSLVKTTDSRESYFKVLSTAAWENEEVVPVMRPGLILLLFAAPAFARHDAAGCGTTRDTSAETLFLHRQVQRARGGRAALASSTPAADRDIGNIAIIEDTGGVVEKLNQFNLDSSTLTFTPSASAAAHYRYSVSAASYDSL